MPTVVPTATLCLLADTEGDSPLELTLAIIKDGALEHARRWLLKPTMGRGHEHWYIKNIHGLDYQKAVNSGVTMDVLEQQVKEWLHTNIGPVPEDKRINIYFPGSIGVGETRLCKSLNIAYIADPIGVQLDPWIKRVDQEYHWQVTHANVQQCPVSNHAKYDPYILKNHRMGDII